MRNPLVSVIVPNYNHARYLKQRLDTVFNQTYQNFEVIILDDKSTDNSLEVINQYKDNPHLSQIVVNEQNSGSPFKQWDKGIKLAKGELVWIAESDDYNELTFLEELITEWGKHKNVVVAFSQYVMCDENNKILTKSKKGKTHCFNGVRYVRKRMARCCEVRNASGALFLKSQVSNISKRYLTYKNTGDYQFWSEMIACGNVLRLRKNLTYWRQCTTSVTSTNISTGTTAKEDKSVFDFIKSHYSLNYFEEYIAYARHIACYSKLTYNNESIRYSILQIWYDNHKHIKKIDTLLLWLIGSIERHLGILI